MDAVSDTSINTIPLTLFYALNNFVKAAYLLQFPNLSLTGSHGMELKTNELEVCNIYALIYSEEANAYLMQGKKECASTYKVFFQTNNDKEISSRDTSLLSRNGYHIYIQNDYDGIFGYLSLTQDSWEKKIMLFILILMEINIVLMVLDTAVTL